MENELGPENSHQTFAELYVNVYVDERFPKLQDFSWDAIVF